MHPAAGENDAGDGAAGEVGGHRRQEESDRGHRQDERLGGLAPVERRHRRQLAGSAFRAPNPGARAQPPREKPVGEGERRRHRQGAGENEGQEGEPELLRDQDVLRIADRREGAADVGAAGEGEEIGERIETRREERRADQRRQGEADDVVGQHGGEQRRHHEHAGEETARLVDPRQALSDGAVETRHLVLRREQHHAEEQRERRRVDCGFRLLE